MEWFYDLLDVDKGARLAVEDAKSVSNVEWASFQIFVNFVLGMAMLGIWLRYDIWSTVTFFAPWKENIMGSVPSEGGAWPVAHQIMDITLGIAAAFITSFIQWAYPRMARAHKSAFWLLAASSIFDMYTDKADVGLDFPKYATGLLELVAQQDTARWVSATAICFVVGLVLSRQRPAFWALGTLCLVSALSPSLGITPRADWEFAITYIGTILCSFVVQTMVVVHGIKIVALAGRLKELSADRKAARA